MDIHPFAVFLLIFIATGTAVSVFAIRWFYEFKTANKWLSVEGEIIESKIRFHTVGIEVGKPRFNIDTNTQPMGKTTHTVEKYLLVEI